MEGDPKTVDDDSLDEYPVVADAGVGAGGGKGKKRGSGSGASSSKGSVVDTRRLTKEDANWPTDLPSEYDKCTHSCLGVLKAAIHQGLYHICWAVAFVRCIQAWLALRGEVVDLSIQHLVNNIINKDKTLGTLTKYNEVKKFLVEEGLVLEKTCPLSGDLHQNCPKSCEKTEEHRYKIRDVIHIESGVNEKDLIKLVRAGPVLAVVEAFESFKNYKDGYYEGQEDRKDKSTGLHVVLLIGYGSTYDGIHYWIVQNSWGTSWGKDGIGFIRRVCGRDGVKKSLLLEVIQVVV